MILIFKFEAMSRSFTFDLIKTLIPSEKAYIKQQIKSSGKHMCELFDDLNKCNSYEKDKFIIEYSDKEYVENLSQNQTYLRKKIVEALIIKRSDSIFEIKIHNQINEALVLIEKKFFKRAKKIIDQCINKALKIEDYVVCYDLVRIIFYAINNNIYFGLSKDEVNSYRKNRKFYLKQLKRMDKFAQLNDVYYNTSNISKQLKAYRKKLNKLKVLNKDDLPKKYPFTAKRIFYFSKAKVARLSGNQKEYIYFSKKIIDIFESKTHFILHFFTEFLGDAINFLNSLIEIRDYDTFFSKHQRITALINANEKKAYCLDDSLIYVIQYYFLQTAYNNDRQFGKAIQSTLEYSTFLEKNKGKLSNQFLARSSVEIAISYLYNKKYEKVITQIEPALNSKDYYSQYVGRIIYIIAHYILNNEFLIDSLFQSFFHYLKTVDKKDQITNIRKLKKYIKNKSLHQLKNQDFEDFVYIHWDLFEKV